MHLQYNCIRTYKCRFYTSIGCGSNEVYNHRVRFKLRFVKKMIYLFYFTIVVNEKSNKELIHCRLRK